MLFSFKITEPIDKETYDSFLSFCPAFMFSLIQQNEYDFQIYRSNRTKKSHKQTHAIAYELDSELNPETQTYTQTHAHTRKRYYTMCLRNGVE